MMAEDHATIEELLAVRSLDGLDGDDEQRLEQAMAAHGDCERCRTLERRFSDIAARLSSALEPAPVDPAMVERILAAPREPSGAALAPAAVDELAERRTRGGKRLAAALTLAAALALVVGGTIFLEGTTTKLGTVTAAQRFVPFTPASNTPGTLTLAFTPGQSGALLWGTDLPDPGAGKVYEVWMIPDGGAPVGGGCLSPSGGRIAAAVPGANLNDVAQMAVTIESSSCPDAPTTTPVMTAQLTA
jgi:anti-sigma-K factor RskA